MYGTIVMTALLVFRLLVPFLVLALIGLLVERQQKMA